MSFKMPKPGKRYSPPKGEYQMGGRNPSRFTGTDIDGEVHQIPRGKKYRDNFDRIFRQEGKQ